MQEKTRKKFHNSIKIPFCNKQLCRPEWKCCFFLQLSCVVVLSLRSFILHYAEILIIFHNLLKGTHMGSKRKGCVPSYIERWRKSLRRSFYSVITHNNNEYLARETKNEEEQLISFLEDKRERNLFVLFIVLRKEGTHFLVTNLYPRCNFGENVSAKYLAGIT